ncbi:MAG TPA: FAD-dependent oxidoreductase [Gemmatimonadales bacterium]|nr:FAD-dependent oxidoreductase [Gemmatimonadales bacterium]
MSSDQSSPTGPDLSRGVPLADLPEGAPFLGHLGDDAVLLVRHDREVSAIGATCTHYGGPLAEGLVQGDMVRCPWHHACFSLRTGEAVGAPALNPVACYAVELRDDRVFIGSKSAADPLASFGRTVEGPSSVVIIGAGAAGSAAAEMLRREGYRGQVTMIDPDPDAPYDRPNLSKDYLAGNAPEEWIPLRPGDFYQAHGIERVQAAVTSIDTIARTLQLSDGSVLEFGALLLATGATPIRPPIPGAELPHVHLLRSLSDSRAIIAATEQARAAVVVGASFIGMEVAAALRLRGLDVTVVAPEAVPFARTLGDAVGTALKQQHESHGVVFRLGRSVAAIHSGRVQLDDGTELPADLVVLGVGVRPALALAEQAGLPIDRGVLVDEFLQTNVAGVFAAGDIARYPGRFGEQPIRIEHWVAAQRQGQAAARNILGQRIPFRDPPFFWTHQWDLGLSYVGHAASWDKIEIEGDIAAGDAMVRYLEGGAVRAVVTLGRDLVSLEAEAAMAE